MTDELVEAVAKLLCHRCADICDVGCWSYESDDIKESYRQQARSLLAMLGNLTLKDGSRVRRVQKVFSDEHTGILPLTGGK